VSFALAADACRIYKAELLAFELDDFIDGVAGGAGDGGNDGARGSGKGVEERGFAYVRTADDGDGGFIRLVVAVGAEEGAAVFVECRLVIACVGGVVWMGGVFAGEERAAFVDFILFGDGVFGLLG
jgi:hypothetical protein